MRILCELVKAQNDYRRYTDDQELNYRAPEDHHHGGYPERDQDDGTRILDWPVACQHALFLLKLSADVLQAS